MSKKCTTFSKSHRHYTYLEEDGWHTAAAGLRSGAACGPAAINAGPTPVVEWLVVAEVTSFLLLVGVAVTELAAAFIAEDYKNFDVHYIVSKAG